MSALHIDSLDKERKDNFLKLSGFSEEFTLAVGTAIMLQINHRESFDFDLFSEKPLKRSLLSNVSKVFGNDINVQVDNSKLLLFTTSDGVKIDFVHFPYPPIYKIVENKPISLFDVRDLASNKVYTIGRRATWRDYVDIFFLIKKFGLRSIISDAKSRFKGEFSEKLFLEQLVYYDDLKIVPIKFIQNNYSTEDIMNYLQKTVREYTEKEIFEN